VSDEDDPKSSSTPNAEEKTVSKTSGTATVTPEERWTMMGEMAPDTDSETAQVDTVEPETPKPGAPGPATPEPATAGSGTPEAGTSDSETSDSETPDSETPDADNLDVETPDADSEGTELHGKRWLARVGLRRAAVLLGVVIAVAAVTIAAVLGWKLQQRSAVEAAADEAQQAARNYAVALTSVSSDNLDQNFADVLGGATGEFKDMYSQSSGQLRQLLVDNKATAEGTVIDSGIKSASTSKVVVLLFVDQTVTNTATPDPRVDRSRVVMTMEKVDGRWLAAKVDLP
jgi:Mce-associated membrane protein